MQGRSNKSELKRIIWTLDDGDYDYIIEPHDEENILSITKARKKRSLDANACFHAMVNNIARATHISDEECKYKMVVEYGAIAKNEDGTPVTVKMPKGTDISKFYKYAKWYGEKDGFNFYIFYKPTHALDKKEMAHLIDGVISECKELDLVTPDDFKIDELINEWENGKI